MLRGRAADHSANCRSSRNPAGRHRNNATVCGSYYADRRPDSYANRHPAACANSNGHTATYAHYHPWAATNGNTDSYPHSYYAASGNAYHTADDGNAATHAHGHSRTRPTPSHTDACAHRQACGNTPANRNGYDAAGYTNSRTHRKAYSDAHACPSTNTCP